ncbi:YopX protein [Lentilactobacillus parabuchneri]|uniref:YopX family protein n=1 Tax=Lentilactobacillus parabuchneri TaxID=152331 RepID=UPI000A2398C7|nr:YopX family protein [Lentilactobacillus parabuchneri]ORN25080.1 YopX protein [Lentilactobacillus parabuchneri]
MSREIKFRAWHMPFGPKGPMQEMVHGKASSILALAEMSPDEYIDEYIVEQFTGLKDRNGQDVYEGDILAWHSNVCRKQDWVGLVQYRGAGFVVQDDPKEFSTPTWLEVACSKDANIVEIIGNIHENPELVEAQHDTRTD